MMTVKPMVNPPSKTAIAAGGISAIGIAVTLLIAPWEGKRNDPYRDIVGVMTVCYGETQGPMRRYSDAECLAKLQTAVATRYAPAVYTCVPGLRVRPQQAAAAISLAYNIGTSGFCRSTAARRFNAGEWTGGCNAFASWVKAGGRVIPGLVNRRRAEIKICMKGL